MRLGAMMFAALAGTLVAVVPAQAAKKNPLVTGVVQSVSDGTITIKGFEEQADGSATNFEKKLKLTAETKFVYLKGKNKKAEETAATKDAVRTGARVAFVEKDGTAEKIMVLQRGKKNK